jgi:PIN domain nuclease of toxin-antitoxin system
MSPLLDTHAWVWWMEGFKKRRQKIFLTISNHDHRGTTGEQMSVAPSGARLTLTPTQG